METAPCIGCRRNIEFIGQPFNLSVFRITFFVSFRHFRMKNIHVFMILLIIVGVHDASSASLSCQQRIAQCYSDSKNCINACIIVAVCQRCVAKRKSCPTICTPTKKNSASRRSKNRNLKKLKQKIQKLLRLL